MDTIMLIGVGIVAVITMLVSAQAFRQFSAFAFPRILAVCVGILCFIALLNSGSGTLSVLLLPYAALGLAIVACLIVVAVGRLWSRERPKRSERRNSPSNLRLQRRD